MRLFTHMTACLFMAASGYAWLWQNNQLPTFNWTPVPDEGGALAPVPGTQEPSLGIADPATSDFESGLRGLSIEPVAHRIAQYFSGNSNPPRKTSWTARYRSTAQRPIETASLGKGEFRTLVIGSLYGNEPGATLLVDQVAEQFTVQSDALARATIVCVRTPNPDGMAGKSPLNSRNVELNRNFPSPNFRISPEERSGPWPGSETETQVVMRLIAEFQPDRVLHVRTGPYDYPLFAYNQRAQPAAEALQNLPRVELRRLNSNTVTGSIEDYVTGTLDREVITMVFPRLDNTSAALPGYRDAILTAATHPRQNPQPRQLGPALIEPVIQPQRDQQTNRSPNASGAMLTGIVETPRKAAPSLSPNIAQRQRPEHIALPMGYIELPPP